MLRATVGMQILLRAVLRPAFELWKRDHSAFLLCLGGCSETGDYRGDPPKKLHFLWPFPGKVLQALNFMGSKDLWDIHGGSQIRDAAHCAPNRGGASL
jgi:hypothetical protein